MSIVDLGAGTDPDPRADVTTDIVALAGVDHVFDLEAERWPFDGGEFEGVIARHVFEHLDEPQHAFSECGRILQPGGWLEVHVPIGLDAKTDPTHRDQEWTWDTPEYFEHDQPYNYGWDLPFELIHRDVEWWCDGPFKADERKVQKWINRHGPGKWLSGVPGLSGVLCAEYRRLG